MKSSLATQTGPEKLKSQITEKTYSLNDIMITLTQHKGNGKDFYCKSKLVTYQNNKIIDSLDYTSDSVGGGYGISKPICIDDHLIFTKHGDYDGRTIIVNDKEEIFNIIGGLNYYDSNKSLLFTLYDSDLSGIAVFDLKTDSIVFKMAEIENRPISFHKAFGERYFILSSNEESVGNDESIFEMNLTWEK